MPGSDDDRLDRALIGALEEGPRDVLQLLPALRKRLGAPFLRGEGILHPALHRALRQGRIEVREPSENGLIRYAIAESGHEASSAEPSDPAPVQPAVGRAALRVVKPLRDPADRGRVQSDVIAHLTSLDKPRQFGAPKSIANLLRRVDRGKRTVIASWRPADFFKRVVLHDGPWILGVVVTFFVVRGFVLEVFRIPSESMLPTLQVSDRVAVWKLTGPPKRYQILTFDRGGTTYVKRAVGLGGEEIALWNGDVFIDRKRLVKPDDVRKALRFPIAAWDFRVTDGRPGPGTDWRRVSSHDELTWLWDRPPLYPNGKTDVHARSFGFRLRDGYLRAAGTLEGGALVIGLSREAYGGGGAGESSRLVLDVGSEGILVTAGGRNADGSTRPPRQLASGPAPGRGRIEIELAYVDGIVHVRAGDWTARLPFEMVDQPLTFEVGARGKATVERGAVDADIHYAQNTQGAVIAVPPPGKTRVEHYGHRIPDDHVFFLGDNTTNSNDSRTSAMGDVAYDKVIGPVVFRVWPPKQVGGVR